MMWPVNLSIINLTVQCTTWQWVVGESHQCARCLALWIYLYTRRVICRFETIWDLVGQKVMKHAWHYRVTLKGAYTWYFSINNWQTSSSLHLAMMNPVTVLCTDDDLAKAGLQVVRQGSWADRNMKTVQTMRNVWSKIFFWCTVKSRLRVEQGSLQTSN